MEAGLAKKSAGRVAGLVAPLGSQTAQTCDTS